MVMFENNENSNDAYSTLLPTICTIDQISFTGHMLKSGMSERPILSVI